MRQRHFRHPNHQEQHPSRGQPTSSSTALQAILPAGSQYAEPRTPRGLGGVSSSADSIPSSPKTLDGGAHESRRPHIRKPVTPCKCWRSPSQLWSDTNMPLNLSGQVLMTYYREPSVDWLCEQSNLNITLILAVWHSWILSMLMHFNHTIIHGSYTNHTYRTSTILFIHHPYLSLHQPYFHTSTILIITSILLTVLTVHLTLKPFQYWLTKQVAPDNLVAIQ